MKNKILYILTLLVLLGCSLNERKEEATLILNITNESRIILPDLSIAKYVVSAYGPATSDNFTANFSVNDTIKFQNLNTGEWDFIVAAYNAADEYIGVSNTVAVTLEYNKVHSINISILEITGNGDIDITLTVPAIISNPILEATLKAPGATVADPISFINISETSKYTYSTTGKVLASGFYILNVLLKDGDFDNDLRGGFTEVVRVVSGLTTSGTVDLLTESLSTVSDDITDLTVRPFDITISGPANPVFGTDSKLVATAANGEIITSWEWYINGKSFGSSSSEVFTGAYLSPGNYLITCIAQGNNILDSAHYTLTVGGDNNPPILLTPYTIETSANSVTIKWSAAEDNFSGKDGIKYRVTYSEDANLTNEENLLIPEWQSGVYTVSGTTPNDASTYFYRVYAKDEAGNISEYVNDSTVYASTAGDDINSGLEPGKPVQSLSKALEVLKKYNSKNLFLTKGEFTLDRPITINKTLNISGGWDVTFNGQGTLKSEDGRDMTIIKVSDTYNTVYNSVSCAIYYNDYNSTSTLSNLFIQANESTGLTSDINTAIYIENSSPKIESCVIKGNDLSSGSIGHELITVIGEGSSPDISNSYLLAVANTTRAISIKGTGSSFISRSPVILYFNLINLVTSRDDSFEYIYIEDSLVEIEENSFNEGRDITSVASESTLISLGDTSKEVKILWNNFNISNYASIPIKENGLNSDPNELSGNNFIDTMAGGSLILYIDEGIHVIKHDDPGVSTTTYIDNGGAPFNSVDENSFTVAGV